jgi:hypothetical protein
MRFLLLLALCLELAAPQTTVRPAAPPDLDGWVARAMRTFEVPGLALAIVKDDAVVAAKGFGVRTLGDPTPVDPRTLFGIASNTKAFTATALGMLVEEKKIEWDAPVIRYLPAFALADPSVTRELTVRDLLVHRSGLGLGAGDLLWWPPSTYNRKEIAQRLRFIPLSTSFRTAYAYENVLYRDPWYGDIAIAHDNGRLVMRFSHTPLLVGDLEPYQRDTFIARWRDRELRADAYVTFALNPDGSIDQVKMRAVSRETDFSYDFQDLLLRPVR